MRGDELVSLLIGYVSGLERVALQEDRNIASHSSPLRTQLNGETEGGIDVEKIGESTTRETVNRMVTRAASNEGEERLRELPGWLQPVSGIGSMSRLVEQGAGQRLEGLGWPVDTDAITGKIVTSMADGLASSTLSALLNVFRGSEASGQWDRYERPRYTWETASNVVDGVAGESAQVSRTDSQYDGLRRGDETRLTSGSRIDVRIEALDARSLLDRKEEIAEAVRQAMLTSGVLGAGLSEY